MKRWAIAAIYMSFILALNAFLDTPPKPEPLPELLTEQEQQQQKEAVAETAELYLKGQELTGFGKIDPEKVKKLTSN